MRWPFACAALSALSAAAFANDTTASTGAGGLVLERTDAIDMASEDLFVSADEIRVRYVFRNRTPRDVATIVAFPMPDRKLADEYGGDVAYPSGFRTLVGGRRVAAKLERKAMIGGRDHSALLGRLKVPIAPGSISDATRAMDRLPIGDRKRLIALGLAGDEQYDDNGEGMKHHLVPLWTVQDRYYWTQRFPAGRDVTVDHRYLPGVGGAVDTPVSFKQFRGSEDSRWAIRRYCMDAAFLAAIDARASKGGNMGSGLPDRRIDYILTTGANWRSPIGNFRMVIDKGKPGNLVSFCADGVKKISPTRYEVRHRNWRPSRDLHVLIVEPRS